MKIYIASSFKNCNEVVKIAEKLQAAGITPLCAWARTKFAKSGQIMPDSSDESINEALRDLEEITDADAVMLFNNGVVSTTGGMHFEMGFSYAMSKPLFVLGERSSVFYNLPSIKQFNTIEELIWELIPMTAKGVN